jgi:hypothetical protein
MLVKFHLDRNFIEAAIQVVEKGREKVLVLLVFLFLLRRAEMLFLIENASATRCGLNLQLHHNFDL